MLALELIVTSSSPKVTHASEATGIARPIFDAFPKRAAQPGVAPPPADAPATVLIAGK